MIAIAVVSLCVLMGLNNPEKADVSQTITLASSIRYLARNKHFWIIVTGSFMLGITMASTTTFLPTLNSEIGGSTKDLGIMLFIMAAAEIVVMMFITKLNNRFGTKALLIAGYLGFFLKNVMFAVSANVWQLFAFCTLQCISFALVIPAVVLYMGERIDKRYITVALLINMAAGNISETIANPVCGWLAAPGNIGVRGMLIVAAIPVLLAALVFIFFVGKKLPEQTAASV